MNHLRALKTRHLRLEERLKEELSHPARDARRIAQLKHEKLLLKDRMARLEMKYAA